MSEQETTPMRQQETPGGPETTELLATTERPDTTEPPVDARPQPEATGPSGPSVPTVLWGLLFGLVAAAAIAHQVSDVNLNLTVGLPVVLLGAGLVLVAWGLAGVVKRRS